MNESTYWPARPANENTYGYSGLQGLAMYGYGYGGRASAVFTSDVLDGLVG